MILEIIGILSIVVIVAFTMNLYSKEKKRNETKISFKESLDLTELPVVTFYNGNKKLNFLLDTGSNYSYINKSVLSILEYTPTDAEISTFGMEGNSTKGSICKMKIYYKKLEFDDLFNVIDLDNAFNKIKEESGVTIHGILGSKFFEKYRYIIDFNELTAYIK